MCRSLRVRTLSLHAANLYRNRLDYNINANAGPGPARRPPPPRLKKRGLVLLNFHCIYANTLILVNMQCLQYVYHIKKT